MDGRFFRTHQVEPRLLQQLLLLAPAGRQLGQRAVPQVVQDDGEVLGVAVDKVRALVDSTKTSRIQSDTKGGVKT